MANLPNLLSCLRLSVVPVLLGLAWINQREVFLLVFILSLLTDIADGLLARKLHLASELGAKLDSCADLLAYMALPFCGWWLRPGQAREVAWWLVVVCVSYLHV